jgi:RNA polymerase sigma-70 factor (ECF subfamily)
MKPLSRPAAARPDTGDTTPAAADPDARIAAVLEEFGALLHQAVSRACPRDRGIQVADVEQDARIRLWKALQSERAIDDLASYIYRVAVTATIDAIRRAKARREEQLDHDESPGDDANGRHAAAPRSEQLVSAGPSPEEHAAGESLADAVAQAMAVLAPPRRQAVGLYLQGLTTQDVATLLGWTEPKARNLVYRGLADLRRQLQSMGIDYDAG